MTRSRRPLPHLGPREADIMGVLWATPDTFRSVREVVEDLRADVAYTTVMTLLNRLYDKALLTRRRQGRGFSYRPRVSQSQYQARLMSSALRRDVDVPEVLLHFVEHLTPGEQATLRGLLKGRGSS